MHPTQHAKFPNFSLRKFLSIIWSTGIYSDSTPETLVTNYEQRIAVQLSKLFLL
jgi:hypothetical protein